jgi:hypothetical protein
MTFNDEARRNDERSNGERFSGIRASILFRHSAFVLRHSGVAKASGEVTT